MLNLNGYASCHVESNCITWFLLISNGLYIYVQICKLKRACIFFSISANFSHNGAYSFTGLRYFLDI